MSDNTDKNHNKMEVEEDDYEEEESINQKKVAATGTTTASSCTSLPVEEDETTKTEFTNDKIPDPLLAPSPNHVREGDTVILVFGDGRQIFAQCLNSWKGKAPPVKINRRSYPTANLVGLPYGTVLELGSTGLIPLPEGEDIIPERPDLPRGGGSNIGGDINCDDSQLEDDEANADDNTFPSVEREAPSVPATTTTTATDPTATTDADPTTTTAVAATDGSTPKTTTDNRHLVDTNTSQGLHFLEVQRMRKAGTEGATIVEKLIENSATFHSKTEFSKAKYIARKQMKYQPRCRMVRCTPYTVCEAQFLKEPRRMLHMREDTLGQILSYSNVCAGCQVLVMETCMGVVTGALAQRMGGYGKIISIYTGQQPAFMEMISRFNLTFAENHSIKWLHSGDVFLDDVVTSTDPKAQDPEKAEREILKWPCPLQDHTRRYLENMKSTREKKDFLAKRCARFARKLTRHTGMESKEMLVARPCDSLVIVSRYDPTATLLDLLPYLAPSSPFVVYCEFMEPLAECFRELQKQNLAINIRLSDTWTREYQMLPGRTHPSMNMSQSGGFLLTGIKLCPVHGHNELDDALVKELKSAGVTRRRGKFSAKNGRKKNKSDSKRVRSSSNNNNNNDDNDGGGATAAVAASANNPSPSPRSGRESKRMRTGNNTAGSDS